MSLDSRIKEGELNLNGGMGAGVSSSALAKAVSLYGWLGVVSGTAPEANMVRTLQMGDSDGKIRFALSHFPNHTIGDSIINRYFIEGGKSENFMRYPFPSFKQDSDKNLTIANSHLEDLIVAGSFVDVFLAKEGHNNPIGINLLYKIQWPLIPGIYGAMLAGADAILMGAGFPREVPPVLDELSKGNEVSMKLQMVNSDAYSIHFNPKRIADTKLERPTFLGIVSNHLGVKGLPNADGYILEGPIAGGHNPPARSKALDETGQPLYGEKDDIDFKLLNNLLKGKPFWLAGSYASKLKEARAYGAKGIQVGTPFAYSGESGIESELKQHAIKEIMSGATVYTDPRASPTGYPFKVVQASNTLSDKKVYEERKRVCNLGYLVEIYEDNGIAKTRCPSEPVDLYLKKGGKLEDTEGRKCLCNGLLTTIGAGSPNEPPLLTSGADLSMVRELVSRHGSDYSANNVIDLILEKSK